MTHVFWDELSQEILKSVEKNGHPFKYFTLGTTDLSGRPQLRTVVLREATKDLGLRFYTDSRSIKIEHIRNNNTVSLLFYHPEKLLQLRIQGKATIIDHPETVLKYWKEIPLKSRKDYITMSAPGSPIKNPDEVEYLKNENFFCIVDIEPYQIEYLKLKRPNHIRVLFRKEEKEWEGKFLVP